MQQRHFEDYGKYPAKSSLTVNIVNRSRQSRYPMLPVEDALKIVFEELKTCSRQSTLLPVDLATNYVLTDPICSPENLPAFPASVKDGYAVIAADGAGHRKVLDSKTSSDYDDIVLQPGYCKRVNTGAPLTKGADAVVEVEQTELVDATGNQENIIIIKKAPQVGQDVRQIGFDVSLGECILNSGYRLASSEIIVSSGDEICEHSVDPLPIGKVRDTNRPMLLSLMKEHGFNAEDLGIVRDEPDNILSLFKEAFKRADVVVSSGGMSMGDRDLLKEVLIHDLGFQLHFGRMFMKPGKPTAFMTGHLFNRKKFYFGLPAPKCPPILDIVASVEQSLFKTEPQQAEAIKQALASFLLINNNKVAEPNLTTMEKKALKDLNRDNSILITKADKGNTVVVLDRSAYLEKMSEMLMRNVYKPIRADPTSKLRTDLLNLLDMFITETNDEALVKIKQHLYFTSNIKCPEMYGLPKTHKLGIPMRPVVASINSVTSKLCSYLKEIIRPLTGLRMSYVKNSKHFCDDIKTLRLQGNEVLVSYDVKDLFTNIPIPKTLSVLKELLNNDITLVQRTKLNPFHVVKLASFCMHEGNYFRFQDRFFTQRNGVPMGSPLSPVLAEVFMEHFEQIAFDNINMDIRPICFKRYVDDIFAVIPTGAEEQFLEHLNRLYPENIVLTIEKETDKKLPFLDALVIRGDDRLTTKIYRKPTNPDAYLHFTSHHPLSVKKGIVAGMVDRAIAICDKNFLGEELQHIKRIFTENGYPFKLITSIINRRLRPKPPNVLPQQPRGPTVVLPYHSILGDTIKRLAKSLDFRVFFKSSPNLRAILRTDKIRIPKEEAKGVVYQIKCGCHASYIGETGNTLFDRFKEHLACVTRYKNARDRLSGAQPRRRGRPQTKEPTKIMEETIKASAIVEHSSQCSHDLQPRILCRESLFHHRKIKEACYIRHNASINRDRGTEISQAWTGLIDQTGCCLIPT
uniref:molybdopterin adenylyltransferase n=1 Tax=Trichuris muris TaxID=70415 RepID=A0A5S6Q4Q2_TRIMR